MIIHSMRDKVCISTEYWERTQHSLATIKLWLSAKLQTNSSFFILVLKILQLQIASQYNDCQWNVLTSLLFLYYDKTKFYDEGKLTDIRLSNTTFQNKCDYNTLKSINYQSYTNWIFHILSSFIQIFPLVDYLPCSGIWCRNRELCFVFNLLLFCCHDKTEWTRKHTEERVYIALQFQRERAYHCRELSR